MRPCRPAVYRGTGPADSMPFDPARFLCESSDPARALPDFDRGMEFQKVFGLDFGGLVVGCMQLIRRVGDALKADVVRKVR